MVDPSNDPNMAKQITGIVDSIDIDSEPDESINVGHFISTSGNVQFRLAFHVHFEQIARLHRMMLMMMLRAFCLYTTNILRIIDNQKPYQVTIN